MSWFFLRFPLPKLILKWAESLTKWHTTQTWNWRVSLRTCVPVARQSVTASPELLQHSPGSPVGQFLLRKALGKTTQFWLSISWTSSKNRQERVGPQACRNVSCSCQCSGTECPCEGHGPPSDTSDTSALGHPAGLRWQICCHCTQLGPAWACSTNHSGTAGWKVRTQCHWALPWTFMNRHPPKNPPTSSSPSSD